MLLNIGRPILSLATYINIDEGSIELVFETLGNLNWSFETLRI